MKPLEKEYRFYEKHEKELVEKHLGKVVVIVGEEVVGVYDSEAEAYTAEYEKREPGTFLIQQCTAERAPQVFHSRAVFV